MSSFRREEGLTLVELLIVIVVLGVLAAVVVFALGNVSQSAEVAACKSNATTVETAIQSYNSLTGGTPIVTADLLTTGPNKYLQSFPVATGYALTIVNGVLEIAAPTGATPVAYGTPGACDGASTAAAPTYLAASDWTIATGGATLNGNTVNMSSGGEERVMTNRLLPTSNFTLNATVNFVPGSGYGIIFDESGNPNSNLSGYVFQVDYGAGKQFLVRYNNNGQECGTALAQQSWPSGFATNASHAITVTVSGQKLNVSFDGTVQYTVADLSTALTTSGCTGPSPTGTGWACAYGATPNKRSSRTCRLRLDRGRCDVVAEICLRRWASPA
ncbi:MAG: prepilin-type N-terminal cleavage/methylation domain-containing protein [Acidimicrobiaceae bacterium]|nr:prepilin-type N-terminal cleavage/methylation domain-containing protein [Acidimicrobiaceae bacterium]